MYLAKLVSTVLENAAFSTLRSADNPRPVIQLILTRQVIYVELRREKRAIYDLDGEEEWRRYSSFCRGDYSRRKATPANYPGQLNGWREGVRR